MVEAASLGQLSTVRKLLDRGTATVEDQDKVVSVCVHIKFYLLCYSKAAIYGTNCVSFLIMHHTLLVCVHVVCMLVLVLAYC